MPWGTKMVFFYGCFALSLDKIGCVRQKSSSKLDLIALTLRIGVCSSLRPAFRSSVLRLGWRWLLRTILSNRWRWLIPSTFTSWMLPTDRAEGWLLRGVMPSTACYWPLSSHSAARKVRFASPPRSPVCLSRASLWRLSADFVRATYGYRVSPVPYISCKGESYPVILYLHDL